MKSQPTTCEPINIVIVQMEHAFSKVPGRCWKIYNEMVVYDRSNRQVVNAIDDLIFTDTAANKHEDSPTHS